MVDKPESNTFCILPWVLLHIDNWGNILPCCLSQDEFLDDDSQPFNVLHVDSIKRAWNSESFRKLRTQLLAGEIPTNCKSCFEHEKCNLPSYRLGENKYFSHLSKEAVGHTSIDGTVPMEFKAFDFKLGNLCNLKCNMCGPHASIQILKDLEKENANLDWFKDEQKLNWFKNSYFWDYVKGISNSVEKIHLTGGEPLIVKEVFDFKEYLVQRGYSKKITLSFNTNVTSLHDSIYQLWPQFKNVMLWLSVDAIGDLNHYIRFPGKWEQIENNLKQLNRDAKKLNLSNLSIHTTVQIYNLFKLPELLTYFAQNFRSIYAIPDFYPLEEPYCFNIRILPAALKNRIKDRFQEYLKEYGRDFPDYFFEVKRKLEGLLEVMERGRQDTLALNELKLRTKCLDQSRGQKIVKMVPEILDLF